MICDISNFSTAPPHTYTLLDTDKVENYTRERGVLGPVGTLEERRTHTGSIEVSSYVQEHAHNRRKAHQNNNNIREDISFLARFEVYTAVTVKNGVLWDVTPCGSCKNRRYGGTVRLIHHGDKNL
jgi:hypothetical protein